MILQGQVALVTGASSGIGRATALTLARAGADVAINYLTLPEAAAALAEQIRALGRRALLCPVDVAEQDRVEAMVDRIAAELGRLDVFVSNAFYSDEDLFHQADMTGFRRTLDVTMWGAFYGLRASVQQMLRQGHGGAAVIVSSPHARTAFPRCMAYNMAKAALDQMARTAAVELFAQRIRVNVVHPGWTDTAGRAKILHGRSVAKSGGRAAVGTAGAAGRDRTRHFVPRRSGVGLRHRHDAVN